MAKNNKTYKFSEDWWERIRLMDISERGIIITAICERVFEGRCRDQVLPEYKQRVLDSILADVEKQLQHASEVSRKRAQAGKAGMSNRWNTSGSDNADNKCYDSDNKCYDSDNKCYDSDNNCYNSDNNCYNSDNKCYNSDNNCYKNDNKCYKSDNNCYNSDNKCYKNDNKCYENDNKCYKNDNKCYPSRARNNNQQHNTSFINNNVDDDENILRAKISNWLTDNSIRMEYICKQNKLIDSPKTDDELKKVLAPYIEEFICHLFTTKPTDKIERIDTISHFTNWIRIHIKQQGNGISQPQRPTEDEYNESF